jgi:hypothetical protein
MRTDLGDTFREYHRGRTSLFDFLLQRGRFQQYLNRQLTLTTVTLQRDKSYINKTFPINTHTLRKTESAQAGTREAG